MKNDAVISRRYTVTNVHDALSVGFGKVCTWMKDVSISAIPYSKCKEILLFGAASTRPALKRRATLDRLRSINPNTINHFFRQSQTYQFLKIKLLNGHFDTIAWQYLHRCAPLFVLHRGMISIEKSFFNIQRKLWKVVQPQVELMRINLNLKLPFFNYI